MVKHYLFSFVLVSYISSSALHAMKKEQLYTSQTELAKILHTGKAVRQRRSADKRNEEILDREQQAGVLNQHQDIEMRLEGLYVTDRGQNICCCMGILCFAGCLTIIHYGVSVLQDYLWNFKN